MKTRSAILLLLLVVIGLLALPAGADPVEIPRALVLGPLPLPPGAGTESPLAPRTEPVPEIDPLTVRPRAGLEVSLVPGVATRWTLVEAVDGGIPLAPRGVSWVATWIGLSRHGEVTLASKTPGDATLFVGGDERASGSEEGEEAAAMDTTVPLSRGHHLLLVRVVVQKGSAAILHLTASAEAEIGLTFSPGPSLTLEDPDLLRHLPTLGSLAASPDSKRVALRRTDLDSSGSGSTSRVEIWGPESIERSLPFGDTRPLSFTPKGEALLLSTKGTDGVDLILVPLPDGAPRTLVRDEKGLGSVLFSPDGRFLLLTSARGVKATEDSDAHRHLHLRQGLPDWAPAPHLHLVEVSTGARRRLTAPGDSVIDDAIFSHDEKRVILGCTAPIDRRPWFRSTILELDLATSSTREITTFTAGWEVRPQAFALSPDGTRLAFIGPPSEIGTGEEHNVYHYRAWMVDVGGGKARPLLPELGCAFHQGGGRSLSWTDERTLVASVLDGTQGRFLAATFDPEGKTVLEHRFLDPGCEITHEVTVSSAGPVAWIIGSDRKSPPELLRVDLDAGTSRRLTTDTSGWHLAAPEDIAVKGAESETLDGWYYRPLPTLEGEPEPASHPLVLYYYGGSSPTRRSFNAFHQTLAARGYGVLVLNPRGAAGRGQEFADHHVADWGPKASADLLAGLDAFLATHPEIDPERIGIYGGSYGGFMTAYLTSTTDRFAAAVSLYGISDLATYWGQGAWGWTYGDMSVGGAVPWENPEFFLRSSPLFRAASMKTPLLLLHGEADTNVPKGESVQLFTALKVLGREVEMVLFPGEDHGIGSNFEKRVLSQRMILEWFDRWLRDDPGAWQARWKKKRDH